MGRVWWGVEGGGRSSGVWWCWKIRYSGRLGGD